MIPPPSKSAKRGSKSKRISSTHCDVHSAGIEKSASHLRAVASRLIASDRKWPTSGSQARRLVGKTRSSSGGFHELYRGYLRVYRKCRGTAVISNYGHDMSSFNIWAGCDGYHLVSLVP